MVVTGIDVSKTMLDVVMGEGPVHRFENSASGLRRWLRRRDRAGTTQAVCEATGGYERLLVSRLRAAGITHPSRVRAPTVTRSRRMPWRPACSRAMVRCSRPRTPVRRRARRNARNCSNCCADADNEVSGSRNGTGRIHYACAARNRHQEFLVFLCQLARCFPTQQVHRVLDNYLTHKHHKVKAWREAHPRFHFHFIPTYSFCLNRVEA